MKSNSVAIRLLAWMVIMIFVAELGVMVILGQALSTLTPLTVGLVDSALLTVLLFPVLYLMVFRPMASAIAVREKAEESLKEAYAAVEGEVEERTTELAGANKQLKSEAEAREQAQKLSEALNRIDARVSSTFDFNEVLGPVMAESTESLGCDASSVLFRENGHWVVSLTLGLPQTQPGAPVTPREAKCAEKAIESKEVFVSDDAFNDERIDRDFVRRRGFRSFIASPLITRGNVMGVIDFYRTATAEPFSAAQIDFTNKLSTSISMAREREGLYAAQQNIADTLQEALLSEPGNIPGVESAQMYRSTTLDPARAGGDFYDIFELDHDRVGIVIGDVSGKGLEAATLTAVVKNTIRAYAYKNSSAAEVVGMTNEVLARVSGPASFVTMFFGILQTESGLLTYCSAGHPPTILKKSQGSTIALQTRSPVIGIDSGFTFVEDEERIEAGDILVLYTDGVTEARCGSEFFGQDALFGCVDRLDGNTKRVPEGIIEELVDRRGCTVFDDIAILAVSLRAA